MSFLLAALALLQTPKNEAEGRPPLAFVGVHVHGSSSAQAWFQAGRTRHRHGLTDCLQRTHARLD